jgi:hypothetical protein
MVRGRPARFVAFLRSEAMEIVQHEAGETPALHYSFPPTHAGHIENARAAHSPPP